MYSGALFFSAVARLALELYLSGLACAPCTSRTMSARAPPVQASHLCQRTTRRAHRSCPSRGSTCRLLRSLRLAAAAPAEPSAPASDADDSSECRQLSAELLRLGVPLPRQRLVALGENSDTRAVQLFEESLSLQDAGRAPLSDGQSLRLRRLNATLRSLRDEKQEEREAYAEAAERARAGDKSGLTESEKKNLTRGVTGAMAVGVQAGTWSSFVMLAAALLLLSGLRGQ